MPKTKQTPTHLYVVIDPENERDAAYSALNSVELWADVKEIENSTGDISDSAVRVNLAGLLDLARLVVDTHPGASAPVKRLNDMLLSLGQGR